MRKYDMVRNTRSFLPLRRRITKIIERNPGEMTFNETRWDELGWEGMGWDGMSGMG